MLFSLLLTVALAQSPVALPLTVSPTPVVQPCVSQAEPQKGWVHAALAAHVVAQFADVSTTMYALGSGRFEEANPLMRWATTDPVPLALIKGGYAVAFSYLLVRLHRQHPKLATALALGAAAVTSWAAHRNAQLIRAAR